MSWARVEEDWASWAALLLGLGFLFPTLSSFLFLSPFLFQTNSNKNYLNSNSNLNSALALKQKEQCTSMNATTNIKLRQILITCETKLDLNASLNIINLRKLNKAN